MQKVTLGKSNLVVPKNGFGALPIQRISESDAVSLLRHALDHGLYYFDTARFYTDSEAKLGAAFHDRRDSIIISTKTGATTVENFWNDLHTSLRLLRTDHVELYQFHNPSFCPFPGDGSGLYEAMLEARQQGKILHIGITNHRLAVAQQAIDSGLYETLQFPFSYLASDKELSLVNQCAEHNIGFIAMKALSGGLITNAAAAYAFLAQFSHVVPIWGIQRLSELDEFISFQDCPPSLSPELQAVIDRDRVQLSGDFCRGCGYCLPCSVGIEINDCNRMSLFLQRAPYSVYLTEDFRQKMDLIDQCIDCGICKSRCPYNLDIPTLLKRNLADFREAWQHKSSLNPEG